MDLISGCKEDYELKSKKGGLGKKVVDGAYDTMIERLNSTRNPNFFFLTYDKSNYKIKNFLVIPKYFFTPDIIEKRKPLAPTARKAGWVGCNILINNVPNSGRIFYVRDKQVEKREEVINRWKKVLFLKETNKIEAKGWLLEIMRCIDYLDKDKFTLKELYKFEDYLKSKYPDNNHIKAKIRQQLQVLRDKQYLEFWGRGEYKLL